MIYVIAIPLALFMINSGGFRTTADTKMYLDAWQVIEGGSIDQWRTPVYPAFLGAIEAAFGELRIETIRDGNDIYDVIVSGPESSTATGHAVVVLQYVALMFAIFYFYKVAKRLARWQWLAGALTLVFTLAVMASGCNHALLSEALSVYGIVFLVDAFLGVVSGKRWSVVGLLLWSIFLVFLRPALAFVPCCVGFMGLCLLLSKGYRQVAVRLIVAGAVTLLLMLGYCLQFKSQYGVFSMSSIGVVNDYAILLEQGVLDASEVEREDMREDVINQQKLVKSMKENWFGKRMVDKYGVQAVNELVQQVSAQHRPQLMGNIPARFCNAMQGDLMWSVLNSAVPVIDFQKSHGIKLWIEFLLIVLYALFVIYLLCKKRLLTVGGIVLAFMVMLLISNWIVVLLGAVNEYSRLLHAGIPLLLLPLASISSHICSSENNADL